MDDFGFGAFITAVGLVICLVVGGGLVNMGYEWGHKAGQKELELKIQHDAIAHKRAVYWTPKDSDQIFFLWNDEYEREVSHKPEVEEIK